MSVLISLFFVCLIGLINAEENVKIDPPAEENQPNWVLLMIIVIVSSLVAIVVGVIALVRQPMVPELPDFQEPNFGPDQYGSNLWRHNETSAAYQEYPILTQQESFPLEPLQNSQSAPSQASGVNPNQAYEAQAVYPPVTVMTQRM